MNNTIPIIYIYILIGSCLLSGILSRMFIKIYINFKLRHKLPKETGKRQKKPTMGGLIVMFTIFLSLIYFLIKNDIREEHVKHLWLFLYAFCTGMIGIIDDCIRIKNGVGMKPGIKIFSQIIVTKLFLFYLVNYLQLSVNFFGIEIKGFCYSFFLTFVVMGFINFTKLSDGLDGMLTGIVTVISLIFGFVFHNLLMVCLGGSCLGFLVTNSNPAKIFMGDTGALFLGALIIGYALMENLLWIMFIASAWSIFEGVTFLIHFFYFNITKKKYGEGKKFFRDCPIHEHFILCGYPEQKITVNSWIITFIFTLIALGVAGVYC